MADDKYKHIKAAGWITQFGLNMISPVVLCVAAGLWLKNRFNAGDWLVLAAILVGVAASVVNMFGYIRTVNREMEDAKSDEECEK